MTSISGTIVSANAAPLTVRDEQGFLREVSLAGAARQAFAPGMQVRATGYRDGFGLRATAVDTSPLVAASVPAAPAVSTLPTRAVSSPSLPSQRVPSLVARHRAAALASSNASR